MEASLLIVVPKRSRPLLLEEVLEKIKTAGIKYGVDYNAIQRAYERPGLKVICARGQQPVDGKDAYIQYYVDVENKGRPAEMENGKLDFKNLNLFITVKQGELLAEKIPPTPGIPGTDVLGNVVIAKQGKDIPLPLGKNVHVVDGTKIIASMAGHLVEANKRINIIPVIEIKGDVDLSTGNIEFVGNVIVHGSVQSGFTVKAEGNVEIAGTVSGGIVEGKNVTIRVGVQGMYRGYVKAAENVVTKFVENATIHAGQDVIVSDVILHSRITAGRRVLVESRRGLIVGGQIVAAEEIRAKVAGTQLAISTDLEVGVNPLLREEFQCLRKDIKKTETTLDQVQKSLATLRSIDPNVLSPDKKEMLLKLTKAQFQLISQLENMRNRITAIELAFEEMRYGRIKIADTVYPGVKIVVGTQVKPIRELLKYVSFYVEDGEIKIGTFK